MYRKVNSVVVNVSFQDSLHGSDHYSSQSTQDCSTHAFTLFSYSRRFSLNSCAAIELAGELGFGSLSCGENASNNFQ